MPKTTGFANAFLLLLLNGTAIANIADNAASAPNTNTYLSLHTAAPGVGGDQTTNETAYTGYARQTVARTSGGWSVSGGIATLVANADFPSCTASPGSPITHFGLGKASSGAGVLWYYGTVTPNITVAVSVIPRLTNSTTVQET